MRVTLVESLCQMTMGWIPALDYVWLGVRGFLTSGNKYRRFPRP
jgi:hypothetical protein